ncbi:MAG TPA: hypothetical protein VKA08_05645, partial [Balneolales bacterium]|nr:hypothetical protein [Balneolales bacterium]
MSILLRIKAWKLVLLTYFAPFIAAGILVELAESMGNKNLGFVFVPFIILTLLIFQIVWSWTVGFITQELSPENLRLNMTMFNFGIKYVFIYTFVFFIGSFIENSVLISVIFILHIIAILFFIYIIYFVTKSVLISEKQRKVGFFEVATLLVFILVSPLWLFIV